MMDFNILNRATFEETTLKFPITCPRGIVTAHKISLDGGYFCLKYMEWRYGVAGGQKDDDGYGWPKVPMQISVNNAINAKTESPVIFSPPTILRDEITIQINNPSALAVTVHLIMRGVKVSPTDGSPILSDKEILGYSLLDDTQKGMLALQEAAADRLDEHLKQLGFDTNFRTLALGGHFSGEDLKALTMQTTGVAEESKSTEELTSLLVGDLVKFKLNSNSTISLEEIQSLASFLLERSWRK